MLSQAVLSGAAASVSASRTFIYEVTGLRQSNATDGQSHAVRSSSSVFIPVSLNRMNEQMRRISRLGGKIVAIHTAMPMSSVAPENEEG